MPPPQIQFTVWVVRSNLVTCAHLSSFIRMYSTFWLLCFPSFKCLLHIGSCRCFGNLDLCYHRMHYLLTLISWATVKLTRLFLLSIKSSSKAHAYSYWWYLTVHLYVFRSRHSLRFIFPTTERTREALFLSLFLNWQISYFSYYTLILNITWKWMGFASVLIYSLVVVTFAPLRCLYFIIYRQAEDNCVSNFAFQTLELITLLCSLTLILHFNFVYWTFI